MGRECVCVIRVACFLLTELCFDPNITTDKARVRVEADLQVIEAKTGSEKSGCGKQLRTVDCVREVDGWKVVEDVSKYDE